MLTIENTYKIINSQIRISNVAEYYIRNTADLGGAYQIHLRCPNRLKSDELIVLVRHSDIVGPHGETAYAMYDNNNPRNRIYLPIKDISNKGRFLSSIEFLVNKYILC